jgi:hypothetical protein
MGGISHFRHDGRHNNRGSTSNRPHATLITPR